MSMSEEEKMVLQQKIRDRTPKLPISKVKRIGKVDPESILTSNMAYVATAFATELFVQSFVEQALFGAQLRRGKKKAGLRLTNDALVECVRNRDDYIFLEDVVRHIEKPKTSSGLHKLSAKPVGQGQEAEQKDASMEEDIPEEDLQEDDEMDVDETEPAERPAASKAADVNKASASAKSILSAFKYAPESAPQIHGSTQTEEDEGDEKEEDEDEEEEIDPEVQTQLQEVERMNVVADLDEESEVSSDEDEASADDG